jgi:hypothetical protein
MNDQPVIGDFTVMPMNNKIRPEQLYVLCGPKVEINPLMQTFVEEVKKEFYPIVGILHPSSIVMAQQEIIKWAADRDLSEVCDKIDWPFKVNDPETYSLDIIVVAEFKKKIKDWQEVALDQFAETYKKEGVDPQLSVIRNMVKTKLSAAINK